MALCGWLPLRFKVSLVVCLAAGAGCGGGSGPSAPSPPAPPAGSVPADICSALGPSAQTAILNGTDCPSGSSSVVLLNMRDQSGSPRGACSGTIISPRAILTAAHCLTSDTATVRVFLGSGAELPTTTFTAHPGYRSGGGSAADVGVVVMPQDLPRNPIPLLLSRDVRVGEPAIIAGWGRNQNDVPATLRAGATTITGAGTILETQFGGQVSSVCSGDSGGPILISEGGTWTIGGVTSATSDNVCNTGTNFYVSLRNSSVSSFVLGLAPDARQR